MNCMMHHICLFNIEFILVPTCTQTKTKKGKETNKLVGKEAALDSQFYTQNAKEKTEIMFNSERKTKQTHTKRTEKKMEKKTIEATDSLGNFIDCV